MNRTQPLAVKERVVVFESRPYQELPDLKLVRVDCSQSAPGVGTYHVSTVHQISESPTVEERVVDGRAHGDDVRAEKCEQEIGRMVEMVQVLGRQNNHVER